MDEQSETQGCDPGGLLTCKDDCSGFEPVPCPNGQSCVGDQCTSKLCNPGQVVCEGRMTFALGDKPPGT